MAHDDAASNDIEDVPSIAAPVLHSIIASDEFGTTEKQWNSYLLVS